MIKSDDSLVRESYLAQGIGGEASYALRTDIYYAASDDTKTPITVSVTGFGKSDSGCFLNGHNRTLRIEKQSDSTYSFYSTDTTDGLQVSGFTVGGSSMKVFKMNPSASYYAGLNGVPDAVSTSGTDVTGMTCTRQIVGDDSTTSCD